MEISEIIPTLHFRKVCQVPWSRISGREDLGAGRHLDKNRYYKPKNKGSEVFNHPDTAHGGPGSGPFHLFLSVWFD